VFGRREYGGKSLEGASNIVFSNGGFDPWSTGGVLPGDVPASSSLETVFLPEGAHHLDFMFSHPEDPPSVLEARQHEKAAIVAWAAEAWSKRGSSGPAAALINSRR
jgi:lysosomal Pro-X carboxypeptidase